MLVTRREKYWSSYERGIHYEQNGGTVGMFECITRKSVITRVYGILESNNPVAEEERAGK